GGSNISGHVFLLTGSADVLSSLSPSTSPMTPPASSCSINESYKYIFLPICYSFTFIFSITLNSIILYRSFRQAKRWNASLIYMVNLASTDFMYGLSLPFLVASYIMRDRWVFGDFMCRLVRFLFYFNLYCSIFFLTCISVHRYLGICHPIKVITLETKRAVKNTCVLVWIVVFALTCPIFRFAQTSYVTRMNCWDDAIDKEFLDYIPYGIILHLIGFFLPFFIIAWCYSRVVLTIFKTLNGLLRGVEKDEEISVFLGARSPTIITITLLFALCFFPFHVTRTIFLLLKVTGKVPCETMTTVSMCYKVTRPLASFNAWLNALLYFLTKDKVGAHCCPAGRTKSPHTPVWPETSALISLTASFPPSLT
uniref:G-protein coupled receptors family 1 profile domain-containing protein n=1 Tax=Xiphophorus couchianus TaxID=32473 RepID=A0A3B5LE61_9TELE